VRRHISAARGASIRILRQHDGGAQQDYSELLKWHIEIILPQNRSCYDHLKDGKPPTIPRRHRRIRSRRRMQESRPH
jgi:hypothetical protein